MPKYIRNSERLDHRYIDLFRVFGSLQTNLLCIMGELAGGVYVAVNVSDR